MQHRKSNYGIPIFPSHLSLSLRSCSLLCHLMLFRCNSRGIKRIWQGWRNYPQNITKHFESMSQNNDSLYLAVHSLETISSFICLRLDLVCVYVCRRKCSEWQFVVVCVCVSCLHQLLFHFIFIYLYSEM